MIGGENPYQLGNQQERQIILRDNAVDMEEPDAPEADIRRESKSKQGERINNNT